MRTLTVRRDLCIINESCPEEAIVTSHVLAQQQNEGALETSLNYNRFLWAVTRIADLWNADKYQKLSRKVRGKPWPSSGPLRGQLG